jgi:hypothetical protein
MAALASLQKSLNAGARGGGNGLVVSHGGLFFPL